MILDTKQFFSIDQDLTAANLITPGQSTIDLTDVPGDFGQTIDLWVEFRVTEAFTVGAGTPRLQVGITVSQDAAQLVNTTFLVMSGGPALTPSVAAANLALNQVISLPVPRQSLVMTGITGVTSKKVPNFQFRFLGVGFYQPNFAASSFGAGKLSAYLTRMPSEPRVMYPAGDR